MRVVNFFSEYAWWGARASNEKGGKRFAVCRGKIRATSSRLDTAENAEEYVGEEIEGKMWSCGYKIGYDMRSYVFLMILGIRSSA